MAELTAARHLAETVFPGQSIGTYGTNLFDNKEPATKHATLPTIVVYDTPGQEPTLSSTKNIYNDAVTIRVVGVPGDSGQSAAQQKIQDIIDFMIASLTAVVAATTYIGSKQFGGGPFPVYDENNRAAWTVSFMLARSF